MVLYTEAASIYRGCLYMVLYIVIYTEAASIWYSI